jgi:hypothetical protein
VTASIRHALVRTTFWWLLLISDPCVASVRSGVLFLAFRVYAWGRRYPTRLLLPPSRGDMTGKNLGTGGQPFSLAGPFQCIRATELEVGVIVDLRVAFAPVKRSSAHASGPGVTSLRDVPVLGLATATANREWRLTLALANQMPSRSSLLVRDASGRDWHIAPAGQAAVQRLREAA